MKIDGLDFIIKKVDIQNSSHTVYSNYKSVQTPGSQSIRIYTETSNQNYMALDKWFNGIFGNNTGVQGYAKTYKKDIIFNTIQIYGMYPTDYEFTSTGILVTFSADYVKGDLELFKLQKLRKAKLEKLKSLQ